MATVTTEVPLLHPGDRLDRDEFERRYEAMPENVKAELIDGVVYLHSAVRFERHSEPHSDLMTWLGVYKAFTPGVRTADNASDRLDPKNEPQPDCMLFIDPQCGGNVVITPDDYVDGAPELVAEISASSKSYDRGPKLKTYRDHGVREYVMWSVEEDMIEWNILRDGAFQLLGADEDDVLRSEVFPGLWLERDAILRGDMQSVLATLQLGIGSDEHQQFVADLAARKE